MITAKTTPSATAQMTVTLQDDDATSRLGAALGHAVKPGDVVLLTGGLGAGKTALTRAAIQARLAVLGRVEETPSPTFTLVQVYEADIPIWHADLYRLFGEDEVYELGLDEAFDTAAVFIEWPDRLGGATPARALHIALDFGPDGEGRVAVINPCGPEWAEMMHALGAAS